MDAIREQFNKPLIAAAVAFVVGLFLGLIVLGWGLWPVQWTDAAPADLNAGYQEMYLRMAVEAFQANPDVFEAKRRWEALGSSAGDALAAIQANPGALRPEILTAFSTAVQASAALPPAGVVTPALGAETPAPVATPGRSPLFTLLLIVIGLTILLGAAFGAVYLMRQRSAMPMTKTPAMEAQEAARQATWTDYTSAEQGPPIAQFMASYKIGDDLFDDSFSIDSASGEFLGECGVGISETIGVGDPKKVTAFEVWLFDKNDIQTITKVLMSAHAFNDANIRNRLATKGEPVMGEPGGQTVLETATLRLVARTVDMNFGEGALPPQSFFDNLILELAVWPKG